MVLRRHIVRLLFISIALAAAASPAQAQAQAQSQSPPQVTPSSPPRAAPQGVAVLASGPGQGAESVHDEAFALARAIYGSSLRPRTLDELRARILAGDPAPATTTKEVRELAELRASIAGDDATSRRLLASIGQQMNVQALLVVRRLPAAEPKRAVEGEDVSDGGAPSDNGQSSARPVVARLFVVETQDFDAARYEPEPAASAPWAGTVTSLSARFASAPGGSGDGRTAAAGVRVPAPSLPSEGKDQKPFYMSPWLWGAVGAAAFIGGFFYFASQDTGDDPIHLQMRVPR